MRRVGKQQVQDVQTAAAFLRSIGLACAPAPRARGFVSGTLIGGGKLFFDRSAHVSDLLHEAGHLAVLPGRFRHLCGLDADVSMREARARIYVESKGNLDGPEMRAAISSGDCEATAWAWAAGLHIGIAPVQIIRDQDYGSEGTSIRHMLHCRAYFGIHGLAHAGFCVTQPGILERFRRLPVYPELAMWLQPGAAA